VDVIAEGFDLAFRAHREPLDDSSLIATPIGEVPMMIVFSSRLKALHSGLHHPDQLLECGLLGHSTHDGSNALRFTRGAKSEHVVRYIPRLISGSLDVLQAAAVAGMGAVCLPRYFCRGALAAGQLANALGEASGWRADPAQMHALVPARRGVTLATRLFLKFSVARLAAALRG
jgi:DNA-binding transcriptional LysR family regulator